MTVKFVIPFENRIRYHEGAILRSAIALKALYGGNCSVMVVTTQEEYVGILQGHFNMAAPVMTVTYETAKRLVTRDFTAVFANELHPDYRQYKELDCGILVLPRLLNVPLDNSSMIFGSSFTMPDVRPMLDLFRGLKRVREPFVLR